MLTGGGDLTEKFNTLRNGLIAEQKRALDNISETERQARDRALLIAGLLGLIGVGCCSSGSLPPMRSPSVSSSDRGPGGGG